MVQKLQQEQCKVAGCERAVFCKGEGPVSNATSTTLSSFLQSEGRLQALVTVLELSYP